MEIRRPELAGAIHQREYDAPHLCESEGLPRTLGMLLGRQGAPYPNCYSASIEHLGHASQPLHEL